jgi:hypothetical protein
VQSAALRLQHSIRARPPVALPFMTEPSPQTLADQVGERMFASDRACHGLGMRVLEVGPGFTQLGTGADRFQ